jgi:hypothetical protein
VIQIVTSLDSIVEDLRKEGVDGYFTVTVTPPRKPKTLQQIRAFHALLHAIWETGQTSYDSEREFKNDIKLRVMDPMGYVYLDGIRQKYTSKLEDIPSGAYFVAIPPSMADATLEQAMDAIDELLVLMDEAGISSKKIDEILGGMEA